MAVHRWMKRSTSLFLVWILLLLASATALAADDGKTIQQPFFLEKKKGIRSGVTGNTLGLAGAGNTSKGISVSGNYIGNFGDVRKFTTVTGGTSYEWKQNGSTAQVSLPVGTKIIKAVLVYGGSAYNPAQTEGTFTYDQVKNIPVTFTTPGGSYSVRLGSVNGQDRLSRFGVSTTGSTGYYSVSVDVTPEVAAAPNGTFSVQGVPATIGYNDGLTNAAGWTLFYIYQDPSDNQWRQINIYTGLQSVASGFPGDITLQDFITPAKGTVEASMLLTAIEGDPNLDGDYVEMSAGGTYATTSMPAKRLSTDINRENNFFSGNIENKFGNIETNGTFGNNNNIPGFMADENNRYGWDIVSVAMGNNLKNNYDTIKLVLGSNRESYAVSGLALGFNIGTADLAMKKTTSTTTATPGEWVLFTLEVTNKSTSDGLAQKIIVSDTYNNSVFEYVADTPEHTANTNGVGSYTDNNGTGIWTLNRVLAPGETVSMTLPLRLRPDITVTEATNAASVTSNIVDPNPDDNHPSTSVHVKQVDLVLTKDVTPVESYVGDILTYTLHLENKGDRTATGVKVTDALPTHLSYVSSTPGMGSYDTATNTWTVGTMDPAATAGLTLKVKVQPGAAGELVNSATASANEPEAKVDNNTATAKSTIQKADIMMEKSSTNKAPAPGDTFSYTLKVTNLGPTTAKYVEVSDPLPAGIRYVNTASSDQGSYEPATGKWVVGDIPVGISRTLIMNVQADSAAAPAKIINTATATSGSEDPNPGNNSATVKGSADVQVIKTAESGEVAAGGELTYSVQVKNNGPDQAVGTQVQDVLQPGLTYVRSSAGKGSYNAGTGIWTVGTLAPGEIQNLSLVAKVAKNALGNIANTAQGTTLTEDPNPGNNNTTIIVKVNPEVDLAVTKVVDKNLANPNDTLVYSITATNPGAVDATDAKVIDPLPAQVSFVSVTPDDGSYNPATGIWMLGDLPKNSARSLKIAVKIGAAAAGSIINKADIISHDTDPNTGNNHSETKTDIPSADVKIVKTSTNNAPAPSDSFSYLLTVTNQGPTAALGVVATDILPKKIQYLNSTAGKGSYNPATNQWNIGDMANGEVQVLRINVKVKPGEPTAIINTATVTSTSPDPDVSNNTSTVGGKADLAVVKTAATLTPAPDSDLKYSITVTNKGPDQAVNTTVRDILPAGLIYMSSKSAKGAYDAASGIWTVGNLLTGESATLEITTHLGAGVTGEMENTAVANTVTPDLVPDNNHSAVKVKVTPADVDLAIGKTVDNVVHAQGDVVTYVLTAQNVGTVDAHEAKVFDTLPPYTEFVSANPAQGVFDATTGIWTIGDFPKTQLYKMELKLRLLTGAAGDIINIATITSKEKDANPNNNRSEAKTSIGSADLSIKKTSDNRAPSLENPNVNYTIVITNYGPVNATNVMVREEWPEGLAYIASSATRGAYDPGARLWTVGNLNAGETQTLSIQGKAVQNVKIVNTVIVTGTPDDPDLSNNKDSVGGIADLVVRQKVNKSTVIAGEELIYTITVTNQGPDTAVASTLIDVLPSELIYVGATPDKGHYVLQNNTWTIGDLLPGDSVDIVFRTKLQNNVSGNVSNTARATTITGESNYTNNANTVVVLVHEPNVIVLQKNALAKELHRGQRVSYRLVLQNKTMEMLHNVNVEDLIPAGFQFVEGTATVKTGDSEAVGLPTLPGRPLRFAIEVPAGGKTILNYQLIVGAAAVPGQAVNTAVARMGETNISNQAIAVVTVLEDPLFDRSLIYGHVYEDVNRNGSMDTGEPGIPGVKLVTVTGMIITADREGRYHIAGEWGGAWDRGRNFILKLDTASLPQDSKVFTENPRVVRLSPGVPTKINFGIVFQSRPQPLMIPFPEKRIEAIPAKVILRGVNFDFDQDRLQAESYEILDQVAEAALAHPHWQFCLCGHTDNLGTKAYNQELSLRRVERVKAYLVSKGVAAGRLTAIGKGETEPIADNNTEEGRESNRRVELEILNG